VILLISASQVARIRDLSHLAPPNQFFGLFYFCIQFNHKNRGRIPKAMSFTLSLVFLKSLFGFDDLGQRKSYFSAIFPKQLLKKK
jgi:hypothetical protein